MFFIIYLMIPSAYMLKIKVTEPENEVGIPPVVNTIIFDELEFSGDDDLVSHDMIVYDDYGNNYQNYNWHNCRNGEYEISVQMSSLLFSGTDDKVEIRLYGHDDETTEWFELEDSSGYATFERLGRDIFCKKTGKQLEILKKIGIRKFGSDRMMIDEISIRDKKFLTFFPVHRWVIEDSEEYIFQRW